MKDSKYYPGELQMSDNFIAIEFWGNREGVAFKYWSVKEFGALDDRICFKVYLN